MRIAVLGAGAWGSALAASFSTAHEVRLWSRRPEDCERIARTRESRYLPGVPLPEAIRVEPRLDVALRGCDVALIATATSGLRETLRAVAAEPGEGAVLWACKGFETASGQLPHEIVDAGLPPPRPRGALSGPSFALEVARGQPTAVVLASTDEAFAAKTAAALNSRSLRLYSSDDLAGVELGGALKNVVAIAAGISDGLALGRNARAALVTRGLAEMTRLGLAMGGRAETFAGLAGLGDLVLTCTGDLSRNREVGMRLAAGATLEQALAALGHVSEGVASARAASAHAERLGVEMPITSAVCDVLFSQVPPRAAVERLLARDPRAE